MESISRLAPPRLLAARPVRVWVVMGLFVLYLVFSVGLLFETIAPIADFPVQPAIEADSGTYWAVSGLKVSNEISEHTSGANVSGNLFGPVLQAKLMRTDLNVMLCNCFLFLTCLWLLHWMPEYDRATFLLLMMANPFLLASLVTLNKEIFALCGAVYFIAYTRAHRLRYRLPLLAAALLLSLMARWQQMLVMLLFVAFESKLSPLRRHRRAALVFTLLVFTVGYVVVDRMFPALLAAFLIQVQASRTILILDRVQAYFGFPLVVIPKILMNCMGHLISPGYFLHEYFNEDFTNWRDQIFMNVHTLLLTALLFTLLISRKLKLRHASTYLLALYLLMTAVNPMVQPRYEYTAYVLLCLEASRSWRMSPAKQSPAELLQTA